MDAIWQTIREEFSDLADWPSVTRLILRLLIAALLGGMLGWEREHAGKSAGMRTHMLVAMGAALFVLVPQQMGVQQDAMMRVLQGLLAGIGFLGAGAIIHNQRHSKNDSPGTRHDREVKGMTTAAGIWMTAAIGIAVGLGRDATAILSTLLAWGVLELIPKCASKHDEG